MFGKAAQIGICTLAAIALSAGAAMAEKIKNPEYEMWSKFKAGAASTVESTTITAGQEAKQTMVTKLVSITPEKAVVETKISMVMMGNKMDLPVNTRDVAAEIDKPATVAGAAGAEVKVPDAKTSEETVSVGGKDVKCKVTEVTNEQNGMKTVAKSWQSAEVPGGMVKMESKTSGAMESNTTMKLVEFTTGG